MAEADAPAWMLCEDIITRLKDELILEAIDVLHGEMKAGRIDINGYKSLLQDKPSELQRDMYIINNLIEREHEIMEQYMPFIRGLDKETDPEKVARIEDLKKFILSVNAISTLMRLSRIAETWAEDTGRYSASHDPEEIMIGTIGMAEDRAEVLEFVLDAAKFEKSEALTAKELSLLRNVGRAIPRRP